METQKKALLFTSMMVLASVFILLTGPLFVVPDLPSFMIEIFGILLIIWAAISRRVSKNDHSSTLPDGYFFVKIGPYEIIRHPIYAGILLIMSSLLEYDYTFLRLWAFIILALAVLLKIVREEGIMEHAVKEYGEYKNKTKRLIPYLF